MKHSLRRIFLCAPAFPAFVLCCLGVFLRGEGLSALWLLPAAALFLALSRVAAEVSWARAAVLCVFLPLGWLRLLVAEYAPFQSYLRLLPRENSGALVRVVLSETPMGASPELAEWDSGRGAVLAEVRGVQTLLSDGMRECRGGVALQTSSAEENKHLRALLPGTILEGQGAFLPPPAHDDPVDGFYGDFLQSRGVLRILRLETWHPRGEELSARFRYRRLLRSFRAALGTRLVHGVRDPESARLLLALGLGMGEFIPQETRQRQVAAGTVHVFAISGMHVGMVALLIGALLRWSGTGLFRQWFLTGLLSVGYVLLTGASASGVRALLMAMLILYAHFRWRTPGWLNALGVAGCCGVLGNPFALRNLGFCYSYLVVAALLIASPKAREFCRVLAERDQWLPRKVRHRKRTAFAVWCGGAAVVATVAWLAGAGLSLRVNHRLNLLAPALNLPLGVAIYLALLLCPLKILIGGVLPAAAPLLALLAENAMRCAAFLASVGAESALCIPVARLSFGGFLLFEGLFFLVLLGGIPRSATDQKSPGEGKRQG